ncbi:MAG: hypothetical protein R3Y61_01325 [Rikenellaceae bacterium]
MKSNLYFLSIFLVVATIFCSCEKADNNNPEEPEIDELDSTTVVSLNYFDFIASNDVECLVFDTLGDNYKYVVKKQLLEKLDVTIEPGNVVTLWPSIDWIPFYTRASSVEEDSSGDLTVTATRADLSEVFTSDVNVVLDTSPYFNPNPSDSKAHTRVGDYELNSYFIDENDYLHPAVIYCEPRFLHLESGEPAFNDANSYGDGEIVAIDIMQMVMGGNWGEWSASQYLAYSITGEVDLKIQLPKKDKEEGDNTNSSEDEVTEVDYDDLIITDYEDDPTNAGEGEMNAYIRLKADTNIDLGCYLGIDFYHILGVKSFTSQLLGSYSINPSLTFGFDMSYTFKFPNDKPLISFGTYVATFMIGPVPIPITLEPSLVYNIGTTIKGSAELTFPFKFNGHFDLRQYYDKDIGWSDSQAFDHTEEYPSSDNVTLTTAVEVDNEASLYLKLGVYLCDVVGPYLKVGPKAELDLKGEMINFDSIRASIKGDISIDGVIGAELKFYKWTFGSFEYKYSFFTWEFLNKSWEFGLNTESEAPEQGYAPFMLPPVD